MQAKINLFLDKLVNRLNKNQIKILKAGIFRRENNKLHFNKLSTTKREIDHISFKSRFYKNV